MSVYRIVLAVLLACGAVASPASAARQIVDLHKLDAYFALFASDSNVPWRTATVRLDTYSGAPVDFSVYQVDPAEVLTAGSNARPRAIDTRRRRPVAAFRYAPPGGYHFQSNEVAVPLGSREGFYVVEARRGNVGEQVWINRTRVGLLTKETPGELLLYGADLHSGRALAKMRVQFVVNGAFVERQTDANGIIRWNRTPRPIYAIAQWGNSFAFVSPLPQSPTPSTIVGIRTDSAVVHAGETLRIVGFARARSGSTVRAAGGTATVSMRLGATSIGESRVPLDGAGAFSTTFAVPATAAAGDYAVLAQVDRGVGGATVHVDGNANGLSLQVAPQCDGTCDARASIPLQVVASQPNTAVHVRVVRSPHVYVGYVPDSIPWATTKWLDVTVPTDAQGRASVVIPHPSDGLASTYGVDVTSGGATAATRIVVPTARATVRLHLDRTDQTLGTPINFDAYANDVASAKPLAGITVKAQIVHGSTTQEQTLTLDANGHARGVFAAPELGTNMVFVSADVDGAQAVDASEVEVVPLAARAETDRGSADARVVLDRPVYSVGDDMHVNGTLEGAQGDALVTFESALGAQATVVAAAGGRVAARMGVSNAPGDLRIGVAFVRNGAIEWTSVPLSLAAAGRPASVPLSLDAATFAAGASTGVSFQGKRIGPGTVAIRISRGTPSGSALFDSAPELLAVGSAATQVSAPSGTTWHPWVDSRGERAQVIGFERRAEPAADVTIAEADTEPVSWAVQRDDGRFSVQLPQTRGRYTLSVLKMTDDGRVIAASSTVVVQ